jgi:DeoR family transcriptional regulator, fructose operon transcriptional repressor
MFEEERKQMIVNYVQSKSRVSVQELCKLLDVSESTIRRDLSDLEDQKMLKRTHGGALDLRSVNFEPTYSEKEDQFKDEKARIAKKAAEFIQDGDSLIIDAGTTTFYLADELAKFKGLTVVTNSIPLMQKLSTIPDIEIIATGGALRKITMAFTGPLSETVLDHIHVDKAFIGTNGLDVEAGLTTPNVLEAAIKQKMISVANKVYVLADHSKIGRVSFARFGKIVDVDACITSAAVTEEQKNIFESNHIQLLIADKDYPCE